MLLAITGVLASSIFNLLLTHTVRDYQNDLSIAYQKQWTSVTLDREASDLLRKERIPRAVFHFGSGAKHFLGVENMNVEDESRHFIYATTASVREFSAYQVLLKKTPGLAKYYHVHYTDAFQLSANLLPSFDMVNMFHIGEYSRESPENEKKLLLELAKALKPGGRLFLHSNSDGFRAGLVMVENLAADFSNIARFPMIRVQDPLPKLIEFNSPAVDCKRVVRHAQEDSRLSRFYKAHCHEYANCTELYNSNLRHEFGVGINEANTLMIVSHPDDELIFGGNLVPAGKRLSDLLIVYCTNDLTRVSMVEEITARLGLAGSIILPHADSPIDDFHVDYRLYADLLDIIRSREWDTIITHAEEGEYGHVMHKILHRIVMHMIAVSEARTALFTFDADGEGIDDELLNVRISLLEKIYRRKATKWKFIKHYGLSPHGYQVKMASRSKELKVCH